MDFKTVSKPIVSSAHLADGQSPAMSELEFSLTLAANAYHRWIVGCAAAAGQQLTPLEILIVHTVRHRNRPKRFTDIMLVLHIEDAHLANYAVKKLHSAGLVQSKKQGKERLIEVTAAGVAFCDEYKDVRERLLIEAVKGSTVSEEQISALAAQLRILSGHYTQAARAAATL